jgi:hypothetical protein
MKILRILFLAALVLVASLEVRAQIQTPAPSPASKIEQAIGLSMVTVDYARPSARGRAIFGDLVPYGQVWRTGANASTDITFSDDVTLNGTKVPAGKYALYSIPGDNEWTIIIYKNTELWGSGGYDQADDVARFTAKAMKVSNNYETFTLAFSDLADNKSAMLNIMWENTMVAFKVETNPEPKVMAQIKEQVMDNPDASQNLLFAAAGYYFDNGKDLAQAHKWVAKANGDEQPKFWMVHLQAKIEAKMGNKAEAMATAKKSMELAKAAGNMDYVRLNEKLLESM